MFKRRESIKQIQLKAFEKGRQIQYEEDLKEMENMRDRFNSRFFKETEKLHDRRKRDLETLEKKYIQKHREESSKKLEEYKRLLTEKEGIIKVQSNYIKEIRKDNKRLINGVKLIFSLRDTILKILDKQNSYYSIVESSIMSVRQNLTGMKDELEIKNNAVKKDEALLWELISAIEEKSDKVSLELIDKGS